MILKSYGYLLSVVFAAWADPTEYSSAEAEGEAAQGQVTLDRLSRLLEALLGEFEPEGMVAAEGLSERLEVSRGQLEAFVKRTARDAVQHTLGLVIPEDCSVTDWEAIHTAVLEIAERIMAEL